MLLAAVRAALRIAAAQGDPIYVILLIFGFIRMSADTDQLTINCKAQNLQSDAVGQWLPNSTFW
jgi:hypothetical protein